MDNLNITNVLGLSTNLIKMSYPSDKMFDTELNPLIKTSTETLLTAVFIMSFQQLIGEFGPSSGSCSASNWLHHETRLPPGPHRHKQPLTTMNTLVYLCRDALKHTERWESPPTHGCTSIAVL